MQFLGRKRELQALDSAYAGRGGTFGVIYGRRRVGKTALLTHWTNTRAKKSRLLYFFCHIGTYADQLGRFTDEMNALLGISGRRYADWVSALRDLGEAADKQDEKLIVVIDEFTYLLAAKSSISSEFQHTWDMHLQHNNIMLVISGSFLGMMQRHVLDYTAPLYGRAKFAIQVYPFFYGATKRFFPEYTPELRVALYAMWGGIAGYWNAIGTTATLEEEIKRNWLTTVSQFHGDPQLLLQDNSADHDRNFSIIRNIAQGYREPGKIAKAIGLQSSTQISPYLEKMISAEIIEKRLPILASDRSRMGLYHVRDPFLRFYFHFIESARKDIEAGEISQAFYKISKHLDEFIGKHTWEELCREWVLRAGNRELLSLVPETPGSLWNKQAQIDVAAVSPEEKKILLGECKWTEKPIDGAVMRGLIERVRKLMPTTKQWEVSLCYFSKTGFTRRTASEANSLLGEEGKNWKVADVKLLSLEEIDADLVEWTWDL